MKFREYDQSQTKFVTLDYRKILGEGSKAVLLNDIVECLDFSAIEGRYVEVGNPGYNPRGMIKILCWGFSEGYFGGRPLSRQYDTDLTLRYFSNDDFPDYRTINLFRVKFANEIADLFAQVAMLCGELGIVGFENMCIDSHKLKANANLFQNKNLKGIRTEQERIKKQLLKMLEHPIEFPENAQETRKKNAKLQRRYKKLEEAAKLLKEAGGEENDDMRYNLSDPDSRVMKDKRGVLNPDYNCHNAVDDKHGVITAVRVTNDCNDNTDLLPIKEASEENTGRSHKHISADCGYVSNDLYAIMEADTKTEYYIPDRTLHSSKKDPYNKWKFVRIPGRDMYHCPEGKELHFVREGTNSTGRNFRLYRGVSCQNCPAREQCLKPKRKSSKKSQSKYRTITVYSEDPQIKAMRDKLDSDEGKAIYRRRMATAEPVNGDMQKNRRFSQFSVRGLPKVTLDYILLAIAHNIRKIILHGADAFKKRARERRMVSKTC